MAQVVVVKVRDESGNLIVAIATHTGTISQERAVYEVKSALEGAVRYSQASVFRPPTPRTYQLMEEEFRRELGEGADRYMLHQNWEPPSKEATVPWATIIAVLVVSLALAVIAIAGSI